ncbi:MAG: thermonuclease family protein [Shinella sp.]|nr:thermonuclease family protein [Shinella sp.]
MKYVSILLGFLVLSASIAFAASSTLTGRASVIDGDTIEIAGERIRLNGIDAPESWQRCHDESGRVYRCGKDAAFALDDWLAASRPTRCEFVERDRYKRFVGTCFRADGYEVNRWLVETGNALDWERYSGGAYSDAQETAKASRAGIWQGAFELPCVVRAQRAKRKPNC